MAKVKAARESPKERKINGRALDQPGGISLDQDEVLRAMMAAKKGKARDTSSSEDAANDSEEEEEGEDSEDEESDSDGESSSGASSSSGLRRGRKRSRSPSVDDDEPPHRSDVDETTSRVKQSSNPSARPPVRSTNPFDVPKAAAHKTFASLGLSQPLVNALAGINITKPTEIQSACVGAIMDGESSTLKLTDVQDETV